MLWKKMRIVLLGCLFLLVTFSGLYFYSQVMQRKFIDSAFLTIEELTEQQRLAFSTNIDQMLLQLNLGAKIIKQKVYSSNYSTIQILSTFKLETHFDKILLANPMGYSLSSEGEDFDISDRNYFQEALKGAPFISDPFISSVDYEYYIAMSMPIFVEDKIGKVLIGLVRLEDLTHTLNVNMQGRGSSYVTTPLGNIVAASKNSSIPIISNLRKVIAQLVILNYDNLETIFYNLDNGKDGRSEYKFNGQQRLMRYEPVGVKDWYIVTIVDSQYVADFITTVMIGTSVFGCILLIIFAVIFIFFYQAYKRLQFSEKKLKLAEESNTLMLDAVPLGCSLWNTDLQCIAANKKIHQLYGLAETDNFNEKFSQCSPEYQLNGCKSDEFSQELMQKTFETGYEQFEWLHKNMQTGELIPFEITLVRVKMNDNYVLAAYQRDLRQQKEAEALIKQTEEYTLLILDALPIACNLWSSDMKLVFSNKSSLFLFGVDSENEYIDKFDLCSPEYQTNGRLSKEYALEYVHKGFASGFEKFEWLHKNIKTGELIPCEVSLVRLRHNDEYVLAAYIRDIRDQKALIAEIEAKEKIEVEKELTEKSAKAKLQFLANMSHEIRTPMNAIVGMSGLLMESTLDERQYSYVRDIQTSSENLLGIINDILDFSKLDSGKMELVCKSFNFEQFLENIESTAKHIVTMKSLAFSFQIVGEIPKVLYADQVRLRQILWNIIGNAAKYTKQGSVYITVTVLIDTIRFDVADTGIGIKEENIPQLFDAFSQFDKEKNTNIAGTGLGLSIVKGYVDLMGGQINVTSVYGKGSVFSVIIPEVIGNVEEIEDVSDKNLQIVASRAKVLVVDDNEINLRVAQGLFGKCGVSIQTASSGLEAIDIVQKEHFDLVFMDHMMPGMNGIDATHAIRNLGNVYHRLPIIALTANAVRGAKEMFLGEGLNDFISKPIDELELTRILIRWLPADKIDVQTQENDDIEGVKEKNPIEMRILEELPEINVNIGRTKSGGDWETYQSSLEFFSRRIPEYTENLLDFLKENKLSDFAIVAHALKGVLATFGIMSLSRMALELEAASKANDEEYCLKNTDEFVSKLLQLAEKLQAIFNSIQFDKKDIPCPPEIYAETMRKIATCILEYNNADALLEISSLLAYELDDIRRKRLVKLRGLLEVFDFEEASKLIRVY